MKVGLAEKTAVLFTKDGDQHNNLFDMQCMWCVLVTLSLSAHGVSIALPFLT